MERKIRAVKRKQKWTVRAYYRINLARVTSVDDCLRILFFPWKKTCQPQFEYKRKWKNKNWRTKYRIILFWTLERKEKSLRELFYGTRPTRNSKTFFFFFREGKFYFLFLKWCQSCLPFSQNSFHYFQKKKKAEGGGMKNPKKILNFFFFFESLFNKF